MEVNRSYGEQDGEVMSSVFKDISAALDKNLNDMVGKPPVDWEAKKYTPVNGTLYLRPTNLQGDTVAVTSAQDETNGIYQVDIFAPADKGKFEATEMADMVADQFKQDKSLIYKTQTVNVRNVHRRTISRNDDGWLHMAIEVTYYAFSDKR